MKKFMKMEDIKLITTEQFLNAIYYAIYDIMRKDSVYRWTTTDNPIYNKQTKNCRVVIGRRCDGRRNSK